MNLEINGKVVWGDGYGRTLGFPTVNLEVGDIKLPNAGVYAGIATLREKNYRAGILINPTGKVEAHLIGYDGDAYDEMVTLKLEKFLRDYKKFEKEEDLIKQIEKDITACIRMLQ